MQTQYFTSWIFLAVVSELYGYIHWRHLRWFEKLFNVYYTLCTGILTVPAHQIPDKRFTRFHVFFFFFFSSKITQMCAEGIVTHARQNFWQVSLFSREREITTSTRRLAEKYVRAVRSFPDNKEKKNNGSISVSRRIDESDIATRWTIFTIRPCHRRAIFIVQRKPAPDAHINSDRFLGTWEYCASKGKVKRN